MSRGPGGEKRAARGGARGSRFWIGTVVVFLTAAVVGVTGLQGWSEAAVTEWSRRDAVLPLGSPRAKILEIHSASPEVLEPGASLASVAAWSFVLEGRGDCGDPTDDWSRFARRQLEQGRTLLLFPTGFPAGRTYVYILGEDELLACRIVAAS
ncbi:MAG: hypothetical protein P1V51_07425 [Deltaproteobacteria bacterium]|nr:hypothetical protein [Deltaproteobacteria bacterium]